MSRSRFSVASPTSRSGAALVALVCCCLGLGAGAGGRARAAGDTGAIAALRMGVSLSPPQPEPVASSNAVLGALLGGEPSLDASQYRALRSSYVTLIDLVVASDSEVRTVGELVELEVSLADWLGVVRRSLAPGAGVAAAALARLERAAASPRTARVGDWLRVEPESGDRALEVGLDVFDLVLTPAFAAFGDEVLQIESLPVDLPGVDWAGAQVYSTGLPQIVIGPALELEPEAWSTELRAPQLRVELSLRQDHAVSQMNEAPVTLTLYLATGGAEARLSSIECGGASRVTVDAKPGLSRIGIGSFTDIRRSDNARPAHIAELNLLGVPVVRFVASNERALRGPPQTLVFEGPFVPSIERPAAGNTQRIGVEFEGAIGSATGEFSNELVVRVEKLGAVPVGFRTGAVAREIEGVAGPLLSQVPAVLAPLLDALGTSATGVDLTVLSVFPPGCSS